MLSNAGRLLRPSQGTAAFCLVLAHLFLSFLSFPASATELNAKAARIAGDEARTRIVIDFDVKPDFTVHYLESPNRIVVDIAGTVNFAFPPEQLEARGIYERIRFGAMSAGRTRLVLTSKLPAGLEVAEARKNDEGEGWRLVLDGAIVTPDQYAAMKKQGNWGNSESSSAPVVPLAPQQPPSPDSVFTVAIDAGHGGIDTGAVTSGKNPVYEKNITLDFATTLARELNTRPGIKAFLTRDTDIFLSLGERVQIARSRGANLFISLHADTLREKSTRGATVYTISDRASDKLADELARRENTSDEVAGVEVKKEPSEVNDILIDLTRRETQAFSISLANSIVHSFEGQIGLINNPHRSAGFRVLTAPDVPSVLLELGFLSNPEDVKQLQRADFRDKLVTLIADAVKRYREKLGG
ncbi:N-acetylmuramoyl-L-alanine amidase [Rhizobium sp. C4]|uniref:N-acetylmuramoyl-L-alanine amidase n=1 Tax=Rhizobium sp. C4 TaxID=1349800 RepID=UPI001E5C6DA4|nr:N-acetylmuramoyl-L-alanine amidase [Rhizobium sp. C4]MCD2171759.1 N-acetylmuramoyl-L-alanine amidase [Rhizobium sp. C4]